MTTHLVTFSDESMSRAADLCLGSGSRQGCDHLSHFEAESFRKSEMYSQHQALFSQPRGIGYWAWKPAIIHWAMTGYTEEGVVYDRGLKDGDTLIYADAGIEFIDNVNYIVDRMDQDIFLFGNMYEHAHWCKRDIVDAVFSKESLPDYTHWALPVPWEFFGKQVQASVIFFRVNDTTRAFVKEWLDWCLTGARIGAAMSFGKDNPERRDERMTWSEFRYLIDDLPSVFPNHPEFQENRHDQAILTTMAYRDGLRLHWWPAIYNDGAFTYPKGEYTDGYPPLFHHHRRRNHEWANAQPVNYTIESAEYRGRTGLGAERR